MNKFWKFIKNQALENTPASVELRISGDIISDDDAWIYEWLGIPCAAPNNFRNELSQYKGQDITVWIDSCGGDVFAAAGIYNALKEHDGKVTCKIDGKAMSAASVIAMAGNEILMSPVSIMMIHNPLSSAQGYASDLRKVADVLDTVKESIMNAYCSKTQRTRDEVSALMDDETYMDADTAITEGFADGKLYDDKAATNSVMNFAFNRLSIQNCASKAFKHLLEIDNKNKIKNVGCQCGECSQTEEDCKCSDCGMCPGCCDNQVCCGCSCGQCSDTTCQNKKNFNKEETIVDLNELKNKYPDIYKAACEEGKQEGIKNERDRIKSIDDLSDKVDKDLLNKAKYEDSMTAEKVAFQAMQEGKYVNLTYLNNLKKDVKNANKIDGDAAPEGDQEETATVLNSVKNIAEKVFKRK